MKVKILLVFLSLASVFTAEAKAKYYINEPVRDNDPKTVGPFIMLSIMLDK